MGGRDQGLGRFGLVGPLAMSLMHDYLRPLDADTLFTDAQWLAAMLGFESALAQAQAECGVIPQAAAEAIAQACAAVQLDREALVARARCSGAMGLAVLQPLQQWLRAHRPEGLDWLHWGSTTQDVVDTAQALLTRAALQALLAELAGLQECLTDLARRHAAMPMLARSLLQPAQVTSFGFKCAQSAAALQRCRAQLQAQAAQALCVQLGGAVGNRAVLGPAAAAVEQALARRLGLQACGYSWHTQRDAWLRLAMEVAVCGGSLAKLAKDWSLMMQYEVGELYEAPRGSTSSAMPHKRNPVHCMQAVAQTQPVPQLAATLLACMAQAHERGLGEWQAEVAHGASLWRHVHAAAAALRSAAQGLQVDTARMQAHIDGLQGVVYSEALSQVLAPLLGKPGAQAAVAECAAQALQQAQPLQLLLERWLRRQGMPVDAALESALAAAANPRLAVQSSAQACGDLLARTAASASLKENDHALHP